MARAGPVRRLGGRRRGRIAEINRARRSALLCGAGGGGPPWMPCDAGGAEALPRGAGSALLRPPPFTLIRQRRAWASKLPARQTARPARHGTPTPPRPSRLRLHGRGASSPDQRSHRPVHPGRPAPRPAVRPLGIPGGASFAARNAAAPAPAPSPSARPSHVPPGPPWPPLRPPPIHPDKPAPRPAVRPLSIPGGATFAAWNAATPAPAPSAPARPRHVPPDQRRRRPARPVPPDRPTPRPAV